jgi:methionyl-tRNA synthetase
LTVNGEKMSKSKGTFILARTYLDHLDPAYLRYYYASKLGPKVDDIDLNLDEFVAKVNADLVGKVVNLASRSARFLRATGFSDTYPDDGGLFSEGALRGAEIAEAYECSDFARAMRTIMALADRANEYVDRTEPWKLAKDPDRKQALRDVSSVALNLYRQLAVYLAPVLPRLAEKSGELLGAPITSFDDARTPLTGLPVAEFKPLMLRVDPKKVQALVESSTDASEDAEKARTVAAAAAPTIEPLAPTCTIDDLGKIDLRIARIVSAEDVPEAKKLLKLTVDLGLDRPRTIFAGIKAAFQPEALVGRMVVVVANLEPRQMKFGLSEGMVVAAGEGGSELHLVSPDSGAKPGQRLH